MLDSPLLYRPEEGDCSHLVQTQRVYQTGVTTKCSELSSQKVRFWEDKLYGIDFGNIVSGVFTPVLAKQTKSFNLVDTLSVGVDRIQRNSSLCSARLNCEGRRRSATIQRG